jgi:pimeloyl-ACP methyl ester carboxylesterase
MNVGLVDAGFKPLQESDVLAPRYSDLLETDGINAALPRRTYVTADEDRRRREYERRQARVSRLIGHDPDAGPFGYDNLPAWLIGPAAEFATGWLGQLAQADRYMNNEGLRGAILRRVLEQLPVEGEIVLVGHSLGSLVAIDLLDHLPTELHVRRLITIGSPAGSSFVHEKSDRLLKRFPYGKVGDWANLYGRADHVTTGRGLAGTFPAAQDYLVAIGMCHDAKAYLQHASVALLIGEAVQGSLGTDLVPAGRSPELAGSVPEQLAVFSLAFAHHVRRAIGDKGVAERYALALQLVQEDMGSRLALMLARDGRPVSPVIRNLEDGKPPRVHREWALDEAIDPLVLCALSNLVQPYDINAGKAPIAALRDMAIEIGIQPESGVTVGKAIQEVRDVLEDSSGVPWTRILLGVGGVALLVAGPLGIALAAPAGLTGAAAITGALASFGPGGMVGGMALLGGLASSGAALTTGTVLGGAAEASLEQIVVDLTARLSAVRARQLLDLSVSPAVWYHVVALEAEVAAELSRLEPLSDGSSPVIKDLRRKREVVRRALTFMLGKNLQPGQLEGGANDEPAV